MPDRGYRIVLEYVGLEFKCIVHPKVLNWKFWKMVVILNKYGQQFRKHHVSGG